MDLIQEPAMTSSVVGQRGPKALPKVKLAPKVIVTDHHSLEVCCWSNPLQLSESWWNHYIWEVYSANDERHWKLQRLQPLAVSTGQQKAPSSSPWQCMSHNQHFKSWTNWAMKFCLIHHIHLTSQLFAGKTLNTTCRMQKMLCKSSSNPKGWIFMLPE